MRNHNFAVGLFVAVALVGFVTGTLWLTGKQGSEPTVSYSMFFEKDVGGLLLGGPVFYLGVEVGTVTAMEIIPGDPMQVRVDAQVLKSAPVNTGTYASLAFQGITGVAVIKLNADPGKHEALQIDKKSKLMVIEVRDTGFSALLAKAPDVVDKMDSMLAQINAILDEENREFVGNILNDLSTVSGALASNEKAIAEIPESLVATIDELSQSLVQIRVMVADLGPGMSATVSNLDQASRSLSEIADRIDDWTAANDTDMNAFLEDGLGQVPILVTEARATLREVEKLMKDLREDPSKLFYKPNVNTVDVEK